MADENVRNGTNKDDDDPLIDQLTEGQHSAFLDDEKLNDPRSGDTEGEDLTSLTAAHQGSRSTMPDSGAASMSASNVGLLDENLELPVSQTGSTNRTAGTIQAGDSPDVLQGNLDLELSGDGGGYPAQNGGERGGGQRSATAAERSAGEITGDIAGDSVGATTGVSAIDELQLSSGDAGQADSNGVGSNGSAGEDPTLEFDLSGDAASSSTRNNDGLGGSGDRDGSISNDDDVVEYVEDPAPAASDSGNGVNPIIGDRFDNNLVGTAGRDMINAQGGDDTLSGGGGSDKLIAGMGNDLLDGGTGDDTLSGGGGDDILIWDSADSKIDGGRAPIHCGTIPAMPISPVTTARSATSKPSICSRTPAPTP